MGMGIPFHGDEIKETKEFVQYVSDENYNVAVR